MRPVHYHAAGGGSLAFDCWRRERNAWLAWYTQRKVEGIGPNGFPFVRIEDKGFGLPRPKVHSDLRMVTCPDCCRAIAKMMREKFTPERAV